MHSELNRLFEERLHARKLPPEEAIPGIVEALLQSARTAGASDIHLCPGRDGLEMKWRIDGVLHAVRSFTADQKPRIVARLKALSGLLTYQTETPQEGRITQDVADRETRISTFPTLFGEKAVIRLFAGARRFHRLADLGFPEETLTQLRRLLQQTGGVILLTGPAGSGKTTTIYAGLREILDNSPGWRSLVSLEDPIEIVVPGVDQSQVNLPAGFDLERGLKALLRQDPDVIMVGEIRDRATAETVFQASLTGHLVLTTFHAGSAALAVSRLNDLGIEPYLLRSGLLGIVCQRLVRKLCVCAAPLPVQEIPPSAPVAAARRPVGCGECQGTGYQGQMLISELLLPDRDELGQAILRQTDATTLDQLAREGGMVSQRAAAWHAVQAGRTSLEEVFRTLGAWDKEGERGRSGEGENAGAGL